MAAHRAPRTARQPLMKHRRPHTAPAHRPRNIDHARESCRHRGPPILRRQWRCGTAAKTAADRERPTAATLPFGRGRAVPRCGTYRDGGGGKKATQNRDGVWQAAKMRGDACATCPVWRANSCAGPAQAAPRATPAEELEERRDGGRQGGREGGGQRNRGKDRRRAARMINDESPARMGRGVANQHAAATSGRIGGHDDSRHGTQQAART